MRYFSCKEVIISYMKKQTTRKFLVVFERTKTGFSAYVPDLPGCIATGKTRQGIDKRIFDAITFHLESLRGSNQKISRASAETASIIVNS